jgi:hypothetical protein
MSDDGLTGSVSRVAALAALLEAIAGIAGHPAGSGCGESLARLINTPATGNPGQVVPGAAELAALRERPGDSDRARALAQAMLLRAAGEAGDPAFRRKLADWRRERQTKELESLVIADPGAPASVYIARLTAVGKPAETAAEPAESRWDLDARLQVVLAAVGLLISLLGLKWPVLQAVALAVTIVAAVIVLYHRQRGRSWRHRRVLVPGAVCLAAAFVLIASYIAGRLTPPSPAITAQDLPANGSTLSATAANAPARVEGVTPMTKDPLYNEATASTKPISATQLADLNTAYLSGSSKAAQILASLGAAQIGSGSSDVTVIGNERSTVTITGLQVVKRCQAPLDGTLFSSASSGLVKPLTIDFNLDSGGPETSDALPGGNVVTLAPGESFTFTLTAETTMHYCQFHFLMTVTGASGTVTEIVEENGGPFALTSALPPARYQVVYIGGSGSPDDGKYVSVNPAYA